jgi:hypothetical protein
MPEQRETHSQPEPARDPRSAAYIASGASTCPVCGDGDIEYTVDDTFEGTSACAEFRCNACGSVWDEEFEMTGIQIQYEAPVPRR